MQGKAKSVVNLTAKTKDGMDARRVTAHHGNTWMVRNGKLTSVVELHPSMSIEDFEFGLLQEWYQIGYIYHRSSAIVDLIKEETGINTAVGWYPVIGQNALDVVKNRPRAEEELVKACADRPSYFINADHPSHWQALQMLQAVLSHYREWIKEFKLTDPRDLPTLTYKWEWEEGHVYPWAISWESCSPDDWAIEWDNKRNKHIRVWAEAYFSFVLIFSKDA